MSDIPRDPPFCWSGQRENDPVHDRVVAFLVMDIQHSIEGARDLANQVAAVASGSHPLKWERIGNAFHLVVSVDGVTIEDVVDEASPTYRVPLNEFQQAVSAWVEYVEQG